MAQRLGDGGLRGALRLPGAERAAGGGEDQPRELRGTAAGHALQDRAVLRVHRDDLTAPLARSAGDELACHHERLLVGQRDPLPGTQGGERRLEPGSAHDPVHDDLHVGMRRGLDEAGSTLPPSPFPRPAIDESNERRIPLLRLTGEQVAVRVRRQRDDPEPLPLARQDLQGGAADRAGRAEDGDADAHITPYNLNSPAAAGTTK